MLCVAVYVLWGGEKVGCCWLVPEVSVAGSTLLSVIMSSVLLLASASPDACVGFVIVEALELMGEIPVIVCAWGGWVCLVCSCG